MMLVLLEILLWTVGFYAALAIVAHVYARFGPGVATNRGKTKTTVIPSTLGRDAQGAG